MIRRLCYCFLVVAGFLSLLTGVPRGVHADETGAGKSALFESINRRDEAVWKVARDIWNFA